MGERGEKRVIEREEDNSSRENNGVANCEWEGEWRSERVSGSLSECGSNWVSERGDKRVI